MNKRPGRGKYGRFAMRRLRVECCEERTVLSAMLGLNWLQTLQPDVGNSAGAAALVASQTPGSNGGGQQEGGYVNTVALGADSGAEVVSVMLWIRCAAGHGDLAGISLSPTGATCEGFFNLNDASGGSAHIGQFTLIATPPPSQPHEGGAVPVGPTPNEQKNLAEARLPSVAPEAGPMLVRAENAVMLGTAPAPDSAETTSHSTPQESFSTGAAQQPATVILPTAARPATDLQGDVDRTGAFDLAAVPEQAARKETMASPRRTQTADHLAAAVGEAPSGNQTHVSALAALLAREAGLGKGALRTAADPDGAAKVADSLHLAVEQTAQRLEVTRTPIAESLQVDAIAESASSSGSRAKSAASFSSHEVVGPDALLADTAFRFAADTEDPAGGAEVELPPEVIAAQLKTTRPQVSEAVQVGAVLIAASFLGCQRWTAHRQPEASTVLQPLRRRG